MRLLIITLCMSMLLATVGCSSARKAPQGEGGIAEHNYSNTPNHPAGLENALYFELQLTQRHYDALIANGAKICFPASVEKARIRHARIARQLYGGLPGDAANDLIIQRDQLDRLERRLNYVQLMDSCLPTESYRGNEPGHMINTTLKQELSEQPSVLSNTQMQYLLAILNNNNQFVSNSSALNPRFINQLSEAAQILRPYPQYHLKLTGHTDSKGSQEANLKLSLERATQVERYLLILGFNPNNIEVYGSGEAQPLFNEDLPEVRLVNRRVSIELIDTSNSSTMIQK